MEMTIHRPGLQTTVQDLGRRGHRGAGVPLSGAMDSVALRIANALVGNDDSAAALEFALVGPEVEFSSDVLIALGGAECEGLSPWRPKWVRAGERLKLGHCIAGCRGYLAIAGGIAAEPVLGSRSTFLRAAIGGWQGRALVAGDVIAVGPTASTDHLPRPASDHSRWRIDPRVLPPYSSAPTIRLIPGAQREEFGDTWREVDFEVTPQSDRMGLRLQGAPLARNSANELLSSAVAPGTVQVPPSGQPLVLMADAQTIGGYPQLGHVIAVDLPLVAQLRPGDRIRFAESSLDEAHALMLARERAIAILREGLMQKLR